MRKIYPTIHSCFNFLQYCALNSCKKLLSFPKFVLLIISVVFYMQGLYATTITIAITSGTNPTCAGSSVTFTATASGGNKAFTYQWNQNGSAIIGQTSGTYTSTTLANDDKITCTQTNGSGSNTVVTSSPIIMTINALPVAPIAPAAQSICSNSSQNFTFNNVTVGSGGNQIEYATNSSFTSSTITASPATINLTAVASGTTVTVYIRSRNSATGCVSSAITTTATVNVLPTAPTSPASQFICSNSAQNFTFSNVTAGSGGNQIEYATNSSFTSSTISTSPAAISLTGVASGTAVTVYIRSRNSTTGCVSSSITTTATVNALPTAPASPTSQSICSNSAQNFTFNNITAGSGGDQIEYATNPSFTGSTINASPATINFTGVASGTTVTIYIRSRNSTTGCGSSAITTTATVNALPSTPTISAGGATTFCAGGSVILTSSFATSYQWYKGGVLISGATSSTYSATASGTYTVIVTNAAGCFSAASAGTSVTVDAKATTASIAATPLDYCGTLSSGSLGGNVPVVGTGAWSQVSGPGTTTFSNVTLESSSATASLYGTYVYKWTITNGTCSSSANVTVNYYATPTVATVASNSLDVCGTTSGSLGGNSPAVGTGLWMQTSGPGTTIFSNPSLGTSTASASVIGTYIYTWTISNGTCSSTSASVTVNYYAAPTPASVATSPLNYCNSLTSGPLGGNTAAVGTGTWSQLSGPGTTTFSNPSLESSTASATAYGTYVYTWTITNGTCSSAANVTVNYYATPTTAATAVTPLNYCGTLTSTSLGGNAATVGTGMWTQASGPGTSSFSNPASGSSTAAATAYGFYVYT